MSSRDTAADLKRLVHIFRLIVTKDSAALDVVNETIEKEPELLARELTFNCGQLEYFGDTGCACALDHQNFRYISGDNVDGEVLDRITRSILCGECVHHDSLPEEDDESMIGPRPASVTLAQAAAAVGYVPVLKKLLRVMGKQAPLSFEIRPPSSPLHLALLHRRRDCVDTILGSSDVDLESYCSTFIYQQQNRNRPNYIDVDYMSTLELCVRMNNFEALKHILQRIPLQASWIIDAMKSDCDKGYEIVSQYMNPEILSNMSIYEADEILHQGIKRGNTKLVDMVVNNKSKRQFNRCPILLTIVYNQPKILELLITSKVGNIDMVIKGFTLLDISNSLDHVDCSSILMSHGIKPTTRHTENPLDVMLEIGEQLELGKDTDTLIEKVGRKGDTEDIPKRAEELTFQSLRKFRGLGIRGLLSLCRDIDIKGPDRLTPLGLAMRHNINPLFIVDVLYFNPCLNQFEPEGLKMTLAQRHFQLFDRSEVINISMLALAIERDLKNYSVRYALEAGGFRPYEGSMAVLLLDCGYDIRADELIHSSYPKLLDNEDEDGRDAEIRERIKDRIDRELYLPKPLKERCRDVLRRHLSGHALHRYIASVNMPQTIKDFIVMKSRFNVRAGRFKRCIEAE